MEKGIFSGETMREQYYQSGYSHLSKTLLVILFDIILVTVHSLHSYEYADANVLFFLVLIKII